METVTTDSPKMEKKSEEFNPLSFEKKLTGLKDTQESIQSMSNWCLKQRTHHKKIVSSWLNVLKRVKVEQRLVLFYLANDVIQYSKRKGYEFVESWGLNLQKATPLVRDEKVRHKILRIFKIWEQRSVYDEEFLSDLTGLLSAGAVKKSPDDDASDFQPQQLVNKIKQCSVLEGDTDMRLRFIHDCHLQLSDADALCANLKERRNMDEVEKELGEGIERVERYTAALQREIVAREALLALLTSAHQYYGTQRGEVKVVAYAYKNFGARVRCLKRKLDDKIKKLPSRAERTPSPPRADEDVPSPGPDEDLQLPNNEDDAAAYNIDKTFSTSISADGSLYSAGFSSFLGAENPFNFFQDGAADAGSKIEVISNAGSASTPAEKPDFNINEFLKTLTSEPPPTDHAAATLRSNNTAVPALQKVTDTLPGLDLLTPESTGNPSGGPPQLSFYGSLDNSVQDEPESYQSDPQWSNTPASWGASRGVGGSRLSTPPLVPPALTTPQTSAPPSAYADTPESPPPAPTPLHAPVATLIVPESRHYAQDMPPQDVDHRGLLPPPPPPPMLPSMPIVELEDVDHRRLPPMTASAPPLTPTRHQSSHKDVDHRNLIPLTAAHQPPTNNRHHQGSIDQLDDLLYNLMDYRVPPPMPASDIVESVDMDLSDDEQQSDMYQNDRQHFNQQSFPNEDRRHFHKNNKVLVGGDNGTRNHKPPPKDKDRHHNLIRINSVPNDAGDADIFESMEKIHASEPQSAPPVMKPMVNPFDEQEYQAPAQADAPPPVFQSFNDNRKLMEVDFDNIEEAMQLIDSRENSDEDNAYSEDIRTRFLPDQRETRNPSPPRPDFLEDEWTRFDNGCANPPNRYPNFQQSQASPRFQRNWNPMRPPFGFRPQGFGPQQFWPRNGPRPPPNRPPWPAQRPRGGFW